MNLVRSYTELIGGIQAKIAARGIRQVDFDRLAGFADGLSGKVFGAAQAKRLGPEKLFDALRAAGLQLSLEDDPEQWARMQKQIAENCQPRKANQARPGNHSRLCHKTIEEVLNYLENKKGGLTLLKAAVKRARSNSARRAANAFWRKKRECGLPAYPENVLRISSAPMLSPPAEKSCTSTASAA